MIRPGGRMQLATAFAAMIASLAACSPAPAPAPPIVAIATIVPEPPPPPEPAPAPPPEPPPSATAEPSAAPVAPPPVHPAEVFRLDELRLIAILSGVKEPRAMLVGPDGLGVVVKIGDPVGRAEELRPGDPGSASTYHVAQIRGTDMVLMRDDPQKPGAPPQRRVVPLAKPKR